MTIWLIDPPQGFSSEQQLTTIGRPSTIRLVPPQGIIDEEAPPSIPGDWFNTAWKKRIPLTIKSGQVFPASGTQNNFPFLINSTFPDLDNTTTRPDGNDIRFVLPDKTELLQEIQSFDQGTGELIAWAKMPTITDGDVIYLYFDNPNAVNTEDPVELWTDYRSVVHMDPSLVDSTGKTTPINNGTTDSSIAKIGNSRLFDGSSFVDLGNFDLTGNILTLQIWFRPITIAAAPALIGKAVSANPSEGPFTHWSLFQAFTDTQIRVGEDTVNANGIDVFSFFKIDGVYDGTKIELFRNGVSIGTKSKTNAITTGSRRVLFGVRDSDPFTAFLTGRIDEVRILNIARTGDFLRTEFNNQDVPTDFYDSGIPETIDGADITNFMVSHVNDFYVDEDAVTKYIY